MSTPSPDTSPAYTVLARRFRPQGFSDVVGQEHVSQALQNAINGHRVAHAYLFTGARGVGKTSTARILAKALNCPAAVDGNPCNECDICDGISAGNDVDVLEIDGASNNGVDDIRQLRANVNVMSMRTQYKVYIIDEVHMLSKGAFNALLKTLEEPPPKVKFVFCTTEPNRVPDTILSRCQRFDFGTIETDNIKGRLAEIATSEGVEVDDSALELVARRAAGSMRDSQSLFDQLLAFGEEHIAAADVHRLLGTATDERLIGIVRHLIEKNQSGALAAFHQALDDGVQLGELTDQILFYLRDLMILVTGADEVDLLAVSATSRDELTAQANSWGLPTIVSAMQILADTKGRMQRVTYGRALAELALVRIGMLEQLTDIGGLIETLRSGEPNSSTSGQKKSNVSPISISAAEVQEIRSHSSARTLVDGKAQKEIAESDRSETQAVSAVATAAKLVDEVPMPTAVAPATQPSPQQDAPSTVAPMAEPQEREASQLQSLTTTSAASATASSPVIGEHSASASIVESVAETSSTADIEDSIENSSAATSILADAPKVDLAVERHETSSPPNGSTEFDQNKQKQVDSKRKEQTERPSAETAPELDDSATNSANLVEFKPENANQIWTQVVSQINDMMKTHVKAVSNSAIFAPNRLEITFPKRYTFSKQYCEKPDALSKLEKVASSLTGQNVRITLVVSEDQSDVVDQENKQAAQSAKKRIYKPEQDRYVSHVMEMFDAQCVKVSPIEAQNYESEE